MNTYEAKQQARKERYEERAAAAAANAESLGSEASKMASVIPFGQPIHVGHHSEKRDRNYRGKINGKFDAAHRESQKADHYASKAESVGKAGISSDDPEAVQKLCKKLEAMQQYQEQMKATNKALRSKAGTTEKLLALGFTAAQAVELQQPDRFGDVGIPAYRLSNNNANIRRVKQRIDELRQQSAEPVAELVELPNGAELEECADDNRIRFTFPGKPDEATRALLKSRGFRWAPSVGAWQRQLNANGRYAASMVCEALRGGQ